MNFGYTKNVACPALGTTELFTSGQCALRKHFLELYGGKFPLRLYGCAICTCTAEDIRNLREMGQTEPTEADTNARPVGVGVVVGPAGAVGRVVTREIVEDFIMPETDMWNPATWAEPEPIRRPQVKFGGYTVAATAGTGYTLTATDPATNTTTTWVALDANGNIKAERT